MLLDLWQVTTRNKKGCSRPSRLVYVFCSLISQVSCNVLGLFRVESPALGNAQTNAQTVRSTWHTYDNIERCFSMGIT